MQSARLAAPSANVHFPSLSPCSLFYLDIEDRDLSAKLISTLSSIGLVFLSGLIAVESYKLLQYRCDTHGYKQSVLGRFEKAKDRCTGVSAAGAAKIGALSLSNGQSNFIDHLEANKGGVVDAGFGVFAIRLQVSLVISNSQVNCDDSFRHGRV